MFLILYETTSLRKTAAITPIGTEKNNAAKVTYTEPTIKAKAPNSALPCACGYQAVLVRNSIMLNLPRKGNASRMTNRKIKSTASTEVLVSIKRNICPRCLNRNPFMSCPKVSNSGWSNPAAICLSCEIFFASFPK